MTKHQGCFDRPPFLQYDIKNKRSFLKRIKSENISPVQLYLGGVVTVFSRQLKIIDYGDEYTKRSLESRVERQADMLPHKVQPSCLACAIA